MTRDCEVGRGYVASHSAALWTTCEGRRLRWLADAGLVVSCLMLDELAWLLSAQFDLFEDEKGAKQRLC
jgi:hypothetical protein